MNDSEVTTLTAPASIYDDAALRTLRERLRCDPGVLRRLRIDFFKNRLDAAECLERAPEHLRAGLASSVAFGVLRVKQRFDSLVDGATKLIFNTPAGFAIESVILRAATGRVALCVSSQVGCAAACEFCATGRMGVARDLSYVEIVDQLTQANRLLREEGQRVRNVVFMGMGEPFHNTASVHAALALLTAPDGFNHPPSRLLVSTVGIPEELVASARRFPEVNHAISLHAASQEVRESIIPLARRYPLHELRDAVAELNAIQPQRTSVMIEYLMLDGLNDTPEHARLLIDWVRGLRVHVNLIPYNHVAEAGRLRATPRERIDAFANLIKASGAPTTIRYSMGSDIDAACGQLVKRENQAVAKALSAQSV